MTPDLTVHAHEAGILRVFALHPDRPDVARVLPPNPLDMDHLTDLVGVNNLREEDVERVSTKDLGDLTLAEFLRIGHDIRSADLAPAAQRLDAAHGHVLLVHSRAFGGRDAVLTPADGVEFLGAFRRNDAPVTPLSVPERERPEILAPALDAAAPAKKGYGLFTALIALALVAAAALWVLR